MLENTRRSSASESNRNESVFENGPTAELDASRRFTAEDAIKAVGFGTYQVKLILLSGIVWMTRGFEFVLFTYISPLLSCYWTLPFWKSELLTGVSSACTVLGCITYGIWSDRFGRRMALSSSLIFLFVFGAVSAGLPSYTWYIIFRWVSAFAVGGLSQVLTLLCEYMPGKQRGRAVFVLSCFWAFGVIVMISILYATLNRTENWRLFVGFSAFPAFLSMILMRWFPESFRFLLVNNQHIAAQNALEEMAEENQRNLPDGQLCPIRNCTRKGKFFDLLNRIHLRASLLLWYMGLAAAITVLGLNLLIPSIAHGKLKNVNTIDWTLSGSTRNDTTMVPCLNAMSQNEFIEILWTNALDFPGFVIFIFLVDYIERKKLLCASFVVISFFVFLLFIPTQNVAAHVGFVFCAKTLIVSQFDLLLLTTAETYPTTERGIAVGMEVALFNVGFLVSPYIMQGLAGLNVYYTYGLLGLLPFSCAIAAVLLPWETRGLELLDFCKV